MGAPPHTWRETTLSGGNPDNLVVVPATGDVFLQEDSDGEQFVRGVTPRGLIYDFTTRSVYEVAPFRHGAKELAADQSLRLRV